MLIGTIKSVSYFPQTPIEQSEDMKYIHHSLAYKVLAKKKSGHHTSKRKNKGKEKVFVIYSFIWNSERRVGL